jgi:hypothetical protein
VNAKLLADFSLILTGLVYSLLISIAFGAGILGIPLLILVLLSFWRYAYSVLRVAAQGKTDIPAPGLETMNPLGGVGEMLHFLVFMLFPIAVVSWHPFGIELGARALEWLLILGVLAVFPASAALLALTSSLESAFHPAALAGFMRELGRDYTRLLGLAIAIVVGARIVGALVTALGYVGIPIARALGLWSVLAVFTLTGMFLRAHRESFHIPGEREPDEERSARLERLEWRKTLDLAYASIRGGLVAEGYRTLRQFSAAHGDSVEVQYWLFENMLDWEDRTHALAVAGRLIQRHLGDGEPQAGLELYVRCARLAPGFMLEPAAAAALAPHARSLGRQGLADELEAAGAAGSAGAAGFAGSAGAAGSAGIGGQRPGTLGYNDRSKPT